MYFFCVAASLSLALAACTYKHELILLTSNKPVLDNAMQLSQSLSGKFRLAHQILLTDGPQTCQESMAILPTLCCVWSSIRLPENYFQHQLLLWNHRRAMAARSVRLGYNVLVLDTDMVVFGDPYKFLKQPPFRDINLMTMGETWPYETNSLLNLGMLYAQNAKPDGPVAQILAEVPDRQLRMANDKGNRLMRMWKVHQNCGTDEQLLFDDVVYGSILKTPMHIVSMDVCGTPEAREQRWANWSAVNRRRESLVDSGQIFTLSQEETPSAWKDIVGSSTFAMKRADLHWWHLSHLSALPLNTSVTANKGEIEWPLEYGGQLMPSKRGPLSLAFQSLLINECQCPMWPDPSSPNTIQKMRSGLTEKFAIAPHFLVASFQARGVLGLWGQHPDTQPRQVLGHIHQTPCDSWIGKRTLAQMIGEYDWGLAKKLKGDNLFFASTDTISHPKLIAFAPCLDLGLFVKTLEDFKAILRGLVAAALLMNRAFVIPDLPCHLPFIAKDPTILSWTLPLDLHHGFMARGPLRSIKCQWQAFMIGGCMAGPVSSLAPWEFAEYQKQLNLSLTPHKNNTITLAPMAPKVAACELFRQKKGNKSHRGLLSKSQQPFVWVAESGQLQSKLRVYEVQQVVYLRRPVLIEWGDDEPLRQVYEDRIKGCFTIKNSTSLPHSFIARSLN